MTLEEKVTRNWARVPTTEHRLARGQPLPHFLLGNLSSEACGYGFRALVRQVLSNVDELFERGEFSAAPDPGWPDCFNSGVFVFQPSLQTHSLLLQHAAEHGSFDGR